MPVSSQHRGAQKYLRPPLPLSTSGEQSIGRATRPVFRGRRTVLDAERSSKTTAPNRRHGPGCSGYSGRPTTGARGKSNPSGGIHLARPDATPRKRPEHPAAHTGSVAAVFTRGGEESLKRHRFAVCPRATIARQAPQRIATVLSMRGGEGFVNRSRSIPRRPLGGEPGGVERVRWRLCFAAVTWDQSAKPLTPLSRAAPRAAHARVIRRTPAAKVWIPHARSQ